MCMCVPPGRGEAGALEDRTENDSDALILLLALHEQKRARLQWPAGVEMPNHPAESGPA